MIGQGPLLGAMIAGLMLAACAPKPMPQRSLDDGAREVALGLMSLTMFCAVRGEFLAKSGASLSFPLDCHDHLSKVLDLLAVRCPALPPADGLPQDPARAHKQAEDPLPDPLLVHLCAVFPWRDEPARL
ncbi:hypothetical protein AB4Z01_30825 [Inquilinus sp. YAF38]|uniref:hypothetical protein n=1 Tax=Inquilinus sp. YAF38 TaxID=3233084 RepID=UPI003F8F26C6